MKNKTCYLSIDFEEWYHIPFMKPYINNENLEAISYCDKLSPFFNSLKREGIPSTVFIVSQIAEKYKKELLEIKSLGNEIGVHSTRHSCYKYMNDQEFLEDVLKSKEEVEKVINEKVTGFRAPMFSASFEKLQKLPEIGIKYDSSSINSNSNPFYYRIKPKQWKNNVSGINEYQIPIFLGESLGGGGYFRITPLWLYKIKLSLYLKRHDSFVFFLHPYEICLDNFPGFIHGKRSYGYHRFYIGRKNVMKKFWKLIKWLKKKNVHFEKMK